MLDGLQRARDQFASVDFGLMHKMHGRALTTVVLLCCFANAAFAQNNPDPIAVARSACAAAANQYAQQTERYSDALKLLYYQTRNDPAEQAKRLADMQPVHESFKHQALRTLTSSSDIAEVTALERQVQAWVIEQLWTFANEKYGQDKLFFKFYINNRCKQQFAVP